METTGLNIQEFIKLLQRQRWLLVGMVVLGGISGFTWRFFHPLPAEASIRIPVVIRNRDANQLWDDFRTDALYHSIFQLFNSVRTTDPRLADDTWLELTEETFRFVVRNADSEMAGQLAEQWANDAYLLLTTSALPEDEGENFAVLVECIEDMNSGAIYTCDLDTATNGDHDISDQNLSFVNLWIGEPEGFSVSTPALLKNLAFAGADGMVMGLLFALFILFFELSRNGKNHEN